MELVRKCKYPIFIFIFFCLSWLFPYSGDDWAWGSSIGLDRLSSWFDNYNGRYVGNLLVLALTRNKFLKAFVMAVVLIGIVYLIDKIIDTKWSFLFGVSMILLMPWQVFSQAVVWTSGFSNYSVSIFLTLIFVYYFLKIDSDKMSIKKQKAHIAPFFILGILCTLIVEHLTIYSLLLGAFSVAYVLFKKRKLYLPYVGYFLGCVGGTSYMFSNTAYQSIASDADGYRTVATSMASLMKTAVINYATEIYEGLLLSNVALNLIFSFLCIFLYLGFKNTLSDKIKIICKICLNIIVLYSILSVIHFIIGVFEANITWLKLIEAGVTIVAGVALVVFIMAIAMLSKKAYIFAFLIVSILCLVAPLFVVTPVGGRCFMATYVMFILLLGETMKLIPDTSKILLYRMKIKNICICAIICVFSFAFIFFGIIGKADKDRLESIKNQVSSGKKEIVVDVLPFDSYIWCGNPTEGTVWAERYKLFYDLPQAVVFIVQEK